MKFQCYSYFSGKIFIFIIFYLQSFSLIAGIGPVIDIAIDNNRLILDSYNDRVVFEAIAENIVRINYQPFGRESPNTLVIGDTAWPTITAFIDTTADPLIYRIGGLTIEIQTNPMRFSAFAGGNLLLNEQAGEGFYEGGINLDVYAQNYYGITNRDHTGLTVNSGADIAAGSQGGAGAPLVWTPDGWGFIADSDSGAINIAAGELSYHQGSATNKADIEIFIIAGTPKDIFKGLTVVSGNPPMPPKFTFGFMNTEWGITESELLNDAQTYRAKNIPIDVYVLDFDWMDWGADNYGEFRWNPATFPSGPSGTLKATTDSMGLKLFGIRKPRVHVNTVQGQYVNVNNLYFDTVTDYFSGQLVFRLDFRKPDTRDWYWDSFVNQGNGYNTGIIGYWNDEADEFGGNFMFMQMQRSNYEGQRSYNDNRVWSINRNFYLGAQRYAYALWSGDIPTGFTSMAAQRLFMLTSLNLGAPWWGMDIGGFAGTPSAENYYRWIQFGTFVPVFRVHGTKDEEREPWNYGAEAEAIAKKYIRLRYELLPYIYSAARQTHENGLPIVRPLILEYPSDNSVVNTYDEWFFGDNILVHPVISSGANAVSVYLPGGAWINYHTGAEYFGPATINYDITTSDIPLFAKAGSVIPASSVGNFVGDPEGDDLLIFQCFGRGDGEGNVYEDDGATYAYENGVYAETRFYHTQDWTMATLTIDARSGIYAPAQRDYMADFRFTERPDSVHLDGQALAETDPDTLLANNITAWAYDSEKQRILARFVDDGNGHAVIAYLENDLTPPEVDSLAILSETTLWIQFSEAVQTGGGVHSAENIDNYSISGGISVLSASLGNSQMEVTLTTTPHNTGEYTITISNIADRHPNMNIMKPTDIKYSFAQTYDLVLQNGLNGFAGTYDTHIAEFFPNNNMGENDLFEAARYAGDLDTDDKNMLIAFDLSSVDPEREGLLSADLILTLADTRNGNSAKNLVCYRLLKPWNEGNRANSIDGDLALPGEATWFAAKRGELNWDNPGGDVVDEPADEIEVGSAINQEYAWRITDYIKFWLEHPDSNFGALLKEENPSLQNGTKVFYSSEHNSANLRPKLVLTYQSPVTSVDDPNAMDQMVPKEFGLRQNYPNPFNPQTTIEYDLLQTEFVTLKVFNILGQHIATLVSKRQQAGFYKIPWNGAELSSGFYIYQLKAGKFIAYKKALLLK